LEVTTSEGQVPLAGGYKAFIRNFQGMYSVCEKQIDWSDGMLLALRWEDYRAYMHITSHHITPGVTLGIYQGPYPSNIHFLRGFHQAI
jgi:hypothetical protein